MYRSSRLALLYSMAIAWSTGAIADLTGLFPSSDGRLFLAADHHIYVSENEGASWSHFADLGTVVYSVATHPEIPQKILVGTYDWIWLSNDNGNSWMQANGIAQSSDPEFGDAYNRADDIVITNDGSGRIYMTGAVRGAHLSVDGGITWKSLNDPTAHPEQILVSPDDSLTVYLRDASWGYIARTSNGGESWSLVSFPKISPTFMVIDVTDPSYLLLGARDFSSGVFLHSTNQGENWSTTSDELYHRIPAKIEFDPTNPLNVYAAARLYLSNNVENGSSIYVSNDGGLSWQPLSSAPKTSARDIFVSPTSKTMVLLGMDSMWRSSDKGETWTEISLGFIIDDQSDDSSDDQLPDSNEVTNSGGGLLSWLNYLLVLLLAKRKFHFRTEVSRY